MSLNHLVNAIHLYSLRTEQLKPENWTTMDVFRNWLPDWVSSGMPMPGSKGEDNADLKLKLLGGILAGDRASDELLLSLFGFCNAELDAALKESDPVIAPIPDHLVLMTFDDSTIDHYTIACPTLERYGGKAILYTTEMLGDAHHGGAGFEDKTRFMTWDQIKELSDHGHEIGNHTLHHSIDFTSSTDDMIREQVLGLEDRCAKHGIPKPTNIGYPGGSVSPRSEQLLHDLGYFWGRGSMADISPRVVGSAWYNPYIHTPLCVPNIMTASAEQLTGAVQGAVSGKVALLVYHEVTPGPMMRVPFEEQVKRIYELGGLCVTFRELSKYVDPVKAWNYIHPVQPEQPKRGPLPGAPGGPAMPGGPGAMDGPGLPGGVLPD